MSAPWLLTLAPLAGLTGNVLAQIAVANAFRKPAASIIAGFLAGIAVTAVLTAPAFATVADWAVAVLTYLALAFGYWAFLNLNITSLRIRILREIVQHPGGMSRAELTARYSTNEFLRRRMERLEAGAQLSRREGRWHLESPLLFVLARTMEMLRALILPGRKAL